MELRVVGAFEENIPKVRGRPQNIAVNGNQIVGQVQNSSCLYNWIVLTMRRRGTNSNVLLLIDCLVIIRLYHCF